MYFQYAVYGLVSPS